MKLIVGNWKMYPSTPKEAKEIFLKIKKGAKGLSHTKVVVCAPALYVSALSGLIGTSKILVGGQNAFFEDEGARTGETSPKALRASGASCVILGHSERRALGESNELVAQKLSAAYRNKLTSILCVGEKQRDEHGEYFGEVSAQLRASLAGYPRSGAKQLVVAYEPIWAIGAHAKRAATPADFREMSILIRRYLTEYFGKKDAFAIPVLYGGSVDDRNAEGFLNEGGADGLLVGRVSLEPERFTSIIRSAHALRRP
jgi:triosephosphate isomerase